MNCDRCHDRGFLVLKKRDFNGLLVDNAYACFCEAGKRYPAWPIIPFDMAPERPLGEEVQVEMPKEWEGTK